jgi:uncharacterized membrane protein YjjP (DUF1212 family)
MSVTSSASLPPESAGQGPTTEVGPARHIDYAELTDVIDLALWAGKLLLECGAPAARVEQTVELIGTSLGCDQLDILVSPNVIMATTTEGAQFRTKARRIAGLHVDLERLVAIGEVVGAVASGRCNRVMLRQRLAALEAVHHAYPRWLVAVAVGVACGAFSRLFGGDWVTFGIVVVAAAAGTALRQSLAVRHYTPLFNVLVTALTAATLAGVGSRLLPTATPEHALAASVLMLVPGVPLINAFDELVKGYVVIAVARGVQGLLISFVIALGLLLAMRMVGVVVL